MRFRGTLAHRLRGKATLDAQADTPNAEGSAATFTATKGLVFRGPFEWRSLAITSLPVPVSPWMTTLDEVFATTATLASTFRSAGLSDTTSEQRRRPAVGSACRQVPQRRGRSIGSLHGVAIGSRRGSPSCFTRSTMKHPRRRRQSPPSAGCGGVA